jgi:hypothetical protein
MGVGLIGILVYGIEMVGLIGRCCIDMVGLI